MTAAPETARLPPEAVALAASARLVHTPCGDGSVAWRLWGDGPPVVLLHGGSGSWTHWLRNIQSLVASGRTVIAADMPGFGESASPPGGEDADAIAPPLRAGLDQLLPGRFDLVGFSFGSLVATLVAEATPRVRRLVLAGAPVLPLRHGRGVALAPWRHLKTQAAIDEVHGHNLRAMMLHRAESVTPAAIALQAVNVPRDRMRQRRLVTTTLMADTLARLHCPTWMLYGHEDALYRGCWPEVMDAVRQLPRLRGVTFIPDAGHWVQFEDAAAVDAELQRVLAAPA